MKITHDAANHKFLAQTDDGRFMGAIVYAPSGGDLQATHTRVDDQFRGQGVAQALLDHLAEYAIAENAKIVPVCSYVTAAFERNPERYEKVIPKA